MIYHWRIYFMYINKVTYYVDHSYRNLQTILKISNWKWTQGIFSTDTLLRVVDCLCWNTRCRHFFIFCTSSWSLFLTAGLIFWTCGPSGTLGLKQIYSKDLVRLYCWGRDSFTIFFTITYIAITTYYLINIWVKESTVIWDQNEFFSW